MENINSSVVSTMIETVIIEVAKNKSPGPDVFTGKFYQIFSEELILILLKLFPKTCIGRDIFKLIL